MSTPLRFAQGDIIRFVLYFVTSTVVERSLSVWDFSISLCFSRNDILKYHFDKSVCGGLGGIVTPKLFCFFSWQEKKALSYCELYFSIALFAVVIEFSIHKSLLYQNLYIFLTYIKFWFAYEIPKKVYFYWPKNIANYLCTKYNVIEKIRLFVGSQ